MPVPKNFFTQPFKEQVDFFKKKRSVSQSTFEGLSEDYHDYSFSVAGLTRADLLEDLRLLVQKAIEDGDDPNMFKKKFNKLISRRGWRPTPSPDSPEYARRVRTIFETNHRQSDRAGRYQQRKDIPAKSALRFMYWVHRDSPDFRPTHKALHMKALERDDPFWDTCTPSCAWGCKCGSFLITEAGAKARGIEILKKAPDPKAIADPEFRRIPGTKAARDAVIKKGKAKLPRDLKETV